MKLKQLKEIIWDESKILDYDNKEIEEAMDKYNPFSRESSKYMRLIDSMIGFENFLWSIGSFSALPDYVGVYHKVKLRIDGREHHIVEKVMVRDIKGIDVYAGEVARIIAEYLACKKTYLYLKEQGIHEEID